MYIFHHTIFCCTSLPLENNEHIILEVQRGHMFVFFIAFLWEEFEDGIVEEEAIKSQRAQSV